ncbi:hypothetical protein MmTuc01_3061 [Methanosarcina mazei Tuc01]|uniref:Uncharacterized protein n=1 Tax=Methanosarcina mazei Tuc01 TaxID=1236903 RepID=M1Q7L2_METMZ|nr:hypothetical protein MmTuc01_3061 [Methanosarcina mazei Tuc01]
MLSNKAILPEEENTTLLRYIQFNFSFSCSNEKNFIPEK